MPTQDHVVGHFLQHGLSLLLPSLAYTSAMSRPPSCSHVAPSDSTLNCQPAVTEGQPTPGPPSRGSSGVPVPRKRTRSQKPELVELAGGTHKWEPMPQPQVPNQGGVHLAESSDEVPALLDHLRMAHLHLCGYKTAATNGANIGRTQKLPAGLVDTLAMEIFEGHRWLRGLGVACLVAEVAYSYGLETPVEDVLFTSLDDLLEVLLFPASPVYCRCWLSSCRLLHAASA